MPKNYNDLARYLENWVPITDEDRRISKQIKHAKKMSTVSGRISSAAKGIENLLWLRTPTRKGGKSRRSKSRKSRRSRK